MYPIWSRWVLSSWTVSSLICLRLAVRGSRTLPIQRPLRLYCQRPIFWGKCNFTNFETVLERAWRHPLGGAGTQRYQAGEYFGTWHDIPDKGRRFWCLRPDFRNFTRPSRNDEDILWNTRFFGPWNVSGAHIREFKLRRQIGWYVQCGCHPSHNVL